MSNLFLPLFGPQDIFNRVKSWKLNDMKPLTHTSLLHALSLVVVTDALSWFWGISGYTLVFCWPRYQQGHHEVNLQCRGSLCCSILIYPHFLMFASSVLSFLKFTKNTRQTSVHRNCVAIHWHFSCTRVLPLGVCHILLNACRNSGNCFA